MSRETGRPRKRYYTEQVIDKLVKEGGVLFRFSQSAVSRWLGQIADHSIDPSSLPDRDLERSEVNQAINEVARRVSAVTCDAIPNDHRELRESLCAIVENWRIRALGLEARG